MDALFVSFGVFLVILSSLLRFLYLYGTRGKVTNIKRSSPCKTVIVVGAGGHGMEMMNLLSGLHPSTNYSPKIYVIAKNDTMSKKKIQVYESNNNNENSPIIWSIMRARQVGQSYFSSVFTTMVGFIHSLPLLFMSRPDLILCNGPGTCIPVCLAGYIFKYLCINSNLRIVYVESVCRTNDLSLSAKILYYLGVANDVIVQWPQLVKKYPQTKYLGRLI